MKGESRFDADAAKIRCLLAFFSLDNTGPLAFSSLDNTGPMPFSSLDNTGPLAFSSLDNTGPGALEHLSCYADDLSLEAWNPIVSSSV